MALRSISSLIHNNSDLCHLVMGGFLRAGALALTVIVFSLLSNTALSDYHCNSSPKWSSPSFIPRDCDTALSLFFRRKVLVHGDSAVEFVRIGTKPRSRLPTVLTPQKYEFGKTTPLSTRSLASHWLKSIC